MDALSLDIRRAGEGDRDAYARLIRQTQNLVSTVALAVVKDVHASEDVAQEVYVQAWSGLQRLRTPESFLGWLRQLTRNRAQDFLRERHRRARLGELTGDEALAAAADPSPDAHQALLRDEAHRALAEAIEALPDEHREVLMLYYREGQSVAQVAALLELSPEAVRKRLSRARAGLKEGLAERLEGDLRTSAPGERFAGLVLGALPGSSGAGALGKGLLAATVKAASPGVAAGLLGAVGGPLLAAVSVRWGLRRELARAQDADEQRSLRGMAAAQLTLIAVAGAAAVAGALLGRPQVVLVAMWAYGLTLVPLTWVWGGRILARRHAMEWASAPSEATRRVQAREARNRWLGLVVGLVLGLGTLLWATFWLDWSP